MFLAHLVQICHFEHPLGGVSNGYRHPQRNQHLNFWNPLPTKTQQERYGTGFRHVNNHFTLTPSILPKPNPEGPPPWDHNFLFILIKWGTLGWGPNLLWETVLPWWNSHVQDCWKKWHKNKTNLCLSNDFFCPIALITKQVHNKCDYKIRSLWQALNSVLHPSVAALWLVW